jgi:hypothetical protein
VETAQPYFSNNISLHPICKCYEKPKMYTNEKPTTAVVLLITLLACSVLCEAVAAVPQADASPAHKGKGHGKHKRDKHDPLSCSYTESCVPTVKQYDNLGAEGPGACVQPAKAGRDSCECTAL